MSPTPPTSGLSSETELKLLLPGADPQVIAGQLGRHPLLRRRPRTVQQLHNVYHDTPEQDLRQHKVALRMRRIGAADEAPVWVQTLKTAGESVGGLSRRGEWEQTVPDGQLQLQALGDSAWPAIDPDGHLWPRLQPAFTTRCTRTLWILRRRDQSEIEIALDVGDIQAGEGVLPICELELELKRGTPEALMAVALDLARCFAVLPGQASKAERGYALAAGRAEQPRRALPVQLPPDASTPVAAQVVLAEAWDQIQRNLAIVLHGDAPEALHQARVGWRRWRSAMRLFRDALPPGPAEQALKDFWRASNPLRELDVACTQTLPAWAPGFIVGDVPGQAVRAAEWDAALQALEQGRTQARLACLQALCAPELGQAWLAWGQWLAECAGPRAGGDLPAPTPMPLAEWARQRLHRLRRKLRRRSREPQSPQGRHALRLLAKRLRYNTEALGSVLPKGRTRRWLRQAEDWQSEIGAERDLRQAVAWLERLPAPASVQAYMRGVLVGRTAG